MWSVSIAMLQVTTTITTNTKEGTTPSKTSRTTKGKAEKGSTTTGIEIDATATETRTATGTTAWTTVWTTATTNQCN